MNDLLQQHLCIRCNSDNSISHLLLPSYKLNFIMKENNYDPDEMTCSTRYYYASKLYNCINCDDYYDRDTLILPNKQRKILFSDCEKCIRYYIIMMDMLYDKLSSLRNVHEFEDIHVCDKSNMKLLIASISHCDPEEYTNMIFTNRIKSANVGNNSNK